MSAPWSTPTQAPGAPRPSGEPRGVITIPPTTLGLLRGGLYSDLGHVADQIYNAVCLADRTANSYTDALARLDATRALLNAIGWESPAYPTAVAIDLAVHKAALARAASNELEEREWQTEATMAAEVRVQAAEHRALLEALLASTQPARQAPARSRMARMRRRAIHFMPRGRAQLETARVK